MNQRVMNCLQKVLLLKMQAYQAPAEDGSKVQVIVDPAIKQRCNCLIHLLHGKELT